jgi:hypothetical protein
MLVFEHKAGVFTRERAIHPLAQAEELSAPFL